MQGAVIRQRISRLTRQQLSGGLRGVERECLRVTPAGRVAPTPHGEDLGSALTHRYITTDFAEALLELITPPVKSTH
ncbi:MAG: glutamate--cysteine ligase, partial [Gammaproteobacteria bacterium]|nr:glutamate--cysteine ligase [Gammaproteobacteria bacterium]